jgi:hypothetical protein
MDEKLNELPQESGTQKRLREYGGKLLLAAAAAGAARSLLFCRADGAGVNVAAFAVIFFACLRSSLGLLGVYEPGRFFRAAAAAVLLACSAAVTMNGFVQTVSRFGITITAAKLIADSFADNRGMQFGGYVKAFILLLMNGLRRIGEPVTRLLSFVRLDKWKYVLAGIVIALPLAAIAVSLLLSADWMFRRMFTVDLNIGEAGITAAKALWAFLWMFFAFYCALAGQAARPAEIGKKEGRRFNAAVAVTFMSVLGIIYLVFCAVQVIFLFGRHTLPAGQTYAGYAREGFFQLMFVCAMNELLILICSRLFRLSAALKSILAVISGCTYIMTASSACRMIMYVQAYGMSFLRILVLWFLLVLSVVLAGSIVYIFKNNFDLFCFCYGVSLAAWLVFAFARPDAIAAEYNVRTLGMTGGVTENMLYDLSEDAVPVLARNIDGISDGVCRDIAVTRLREVYAEAEERDARSFNFSMMRAKRAIEKTAAAEAPASK